MDEITIIEIQAPGFLAITEPPPKNPARIYIASLSKGSRPTMFSALAACATYLRNSTPEETWSHLSKQEKRDLQEELIDETPWYALRFQHIQVLRSILSEHYSAGTANKMMTAVKQTLHTAWNLGQMTTDDYMRAVDVKGLPGNVLDQAAGRCLRAGEKVALFKACTDDKKPMAAARDAAIIAVGLGCGLRRQEIADMDMAAIQGDNLIITGKRNKTRLIPMPQGTRVWLNAWLKKRGTAPGRIFQDVDKADNIKRDSISPQSVQKILTRRAKIADIQNITPHDMRRTYATELIHAGTPMPVAQKLMGHASVATTAKYDRSTVEAMIKAAKSIHIPTGK
jgi:integrase